MGTGACLRSSRFICTRSIRVGQITLISKICFGIFATVELSSRLVENKLLVRIGPEAFIVGLNRFVVLMREQKPVAARHPFLAAGNSSGSDRRFIGIVLQLLDVAANFLFVRCVRLFS